MTTVALFIVPGCLILVLAQFVMLGKLALVYGLIVAPLLSLMLAGLYIIPGSNLAPATSTAFWIMRCQLAITPVLSLFLTFTFSITFPQLQQSPIVVLIFLILLGTWVGGALSVRLELHPRADTAPARWLLAGSALAIGGALWWSPLRASEAGLFIPFCAGLGVAMLRPLSYLWEAPLGLMLTFAAVRGASPAKMLVFHPASFDELCLLPLPGLSELLARTCADEPQIGVDWLLRVARHHGQGRAGRHAIMQIIQRRQIAHPLLLRLSASAAGTALLRDLVEQSRKAHPLLTAYTALANTSEPTAWPVVIAWHHQALLDTKDWSGGAALLALLDAAAGTLNADRWPAALAYLRAVPLSVVRQTDAVGVALGQLQTWANTEHTGLATNQDALPLVPNSELQTMEGWLGRLVAAMREHLQFLLTVELHKARPTSALQADRIRMRQP